MSKWKVESKKEIKYFSDYEIAKAFFFSAIGKYLSNEDAFEQGLMLPVLDFYEGFIDDNKHTFTDKFSISMAASKLYGRYFTKNEIEVDFGILGPMYVHMDNLNGMHLFADISSDVFYLSCYDKNYSCLIYTNAINFIDETKTYFFKSKQDLSFHKRQQSHRPYDLDIKMSYVLDEK